TIQGGLALTGNITNFAWASPYYYNCSNNIDGGLNVHDLNTDFYGIFSTPLSFGELNAGCAGGTINGGASFQNISSSGVELDGYTVNGGVTFANDTGFNEIEASTVHGSASCDVASNVQNDHSGPGDDTKTYTGTNSGCPA